MAKPQPSDLELQVLSVLWAHGPGTVREIYRALPDGKQRAYTTVLTVLQNLERKRLVGHRREGNRHVYTARISRDRVLEPLVQRLLRHAFRGRASQLVHYLLSDPAVDPDELEQIRRLLARHDQGPGKEGEA